MTEEQFQKTIIDLAHINGWTVAHFRKAQTKRGNWITPVGGDGKGFPDLVLVRDRVIFAELKSDKGTLRPDQKIWRDKLLEAKQAWYMWKPKDWDIIVETLKRVNREKIIAEMMAIGRQLGEM
jgi:hypothetical protein